MATFINKRQLGVGAFNTAYLSDDGKSVFKVQHRAAETDLPERSVRLWNEINAHVEPPAYLETVDGLGTGWICPFIDGVQASDDEISSSLVDIYNNSGRVVVDAAVMNNFLKRADGSVVCIDIGYALQLENKAAPATGRARSYSVASRNAKKEVYSEANFTKWAEKGNPHTVNTTKALLFLQQQSPLDLNATCLKNNPLLTKRLAAAYDGQNVDAALQAFKLASQVVDRDSAFYKCVDSFVEDELAPYIASQGAGANLSMREQLEKHKEQIVGAAGYEELSDTDKERYILDNLHTIMGAVCEENESLTQGYKANLLKSIESEAFTTFYQKNNQLFQEVGINSKVVQTILSHKKQSIKEQAESVVEDMSIENFTKMKEKSISAMDLSLPEEALQSIAGTKQGLDNSGLFDESAAYLLQQEMAPYFYFNPGDLALAEEELQANKSLVMAKGPKDYESMLLAMREVLDNAGLSEADNVNRQDEYVDQCFKQAVGHYCTSYAQWLYAKTQGNEEVANAAAREAESLLLAQKESIVADIPMGDPANFGQAIYNRFQQALPSSEQIEQKVAASFAAKTMDFKAALAAQRPAPVRSYVVDPDFVETFTPPAAGTVISQQVFTTTKSFAELQSLLSSLVAEGKLAPMAGNTQSYVVCSPKDLPVLCQTLDLVEPPNRGVGVALMQR